MYQTNKIGRALGIIGLALLVAGALGPWRYGKLTEYAWQPLWSVLGSIIGGFVLLAFCALSGYSFIEMRYHAGKSVIGSGLIWFAVLLGILFVAPVVSVIIWGTPSANPVVTNGSIGWGLIVGTVGALLHVVGLRLQIGAQTMAERSSTT